MYLPTSIPSHLSFHHNLLSLSLFGALFVSLPSSLSLSLFLFLCLSLFLFVLLFLSLSHSLLLVSFFVILSLILITSNGLHVSLLLQEVKCNFWTCSLYGRILTGFSFFWHFLLSLRFSPIPSEADPSNTSSETSLSACETSLTS